DLFSPGRMADLLVQYERLLEQIVKDPAQHAGEFSLVTPTAAAVLPNPAQPLRTHNEGSVLDPLAQQAQREPDQIAVMDKAARWTYRELDARSNQLANWLRAQGIRSQEVVAIYAHRSVALVWAMLGVWKAGAAFLILDPRHPPARLAERIRLAKPRAWLQLIEADTLPEALEEAALSCPCHLVLPSAQQADGCQPLARCSTQAPKITVG